MEIRRWWFNFLSDELKLFLGLLAVLAVFFGITLAQTEAGTTYDLGTRTDVGGEAVLVTETTGFPTTNERAGSGINFGFLDTAGLTTQRGSSGNALIRDGLGSDTPKTFQIDGLAPGNYLLRFYARNSANAISTAVTSGNRTARLEASPEQVARGELITAAEQGTISFTASPLNSPTWRLNYFEVIAVDQEPAEPSFELSVNPSSQEVTAGGIAEYRLDINPQNQFGGSVRLSVTEIPDLLTSEVSPANLSDLPATSQLLLEAFSETSPGSYSVTVQAEADSISMTQNVVVELIVQEAPSEPTEEPESPSPPPERPSEQPPTEEPEEPADPSREEIRENALQMLDLSDSFTDEAPTRESLSTLPALRVDLARRTEEEFVDNEGIVGNTLDTFRDTGTINTVVDDAPPSADFGRPEETQEQSSATSRVLQFLFGASPTQ